jgi:inhibitor of KinA sporulation pathway (predicted exonuclease)
MRLNLPLLIVDLEATCDENPPADFQMETIEVGAVLMDAGGLISDIFQSFVRPVGNPQLTTFCKKLTGISQADIDTAPSFPVVADHLRGMVGSSVVCWASWGKWDATQLQRDSERHGIRRPLACPHVNAKRLFASVQSLGKEVGLRKACELAGVAWIGTHHRAVDDALNVAQLVPWLKGERSIRA